MSAASITSDVPYTNMHRVAPNSIAQYYHSMFIDAQKKKTVRHAHDRGGHVHMDISAHACGTCDGTQSTCADIHIKKNYRVHGAVSAPRRYGTRTNRIPQG